MEIELEMFFGVFEVFNFYKAKNLKIVPKLSTTSTVSVTFQFYIISGNLQNMLLNPFPYSFLAFLSFIRYLGLLNILKYNFGTSCIKLRGFFGGEGGAGIFIVEKNVVVKLDDFTSHKVLIVQSDLELLLPPSRTQSV